MTEPYFEAIKWLTHPTPEGSDRSDLLAKAFIHHALSYPGRKIWTYDHIPTKTASVNLTRRIKELVVKEKLNIVVGPGWVEAGKETAWKKKPLSSI